MITAGRIREMLNTRPFRPFRLFLSDGSHHDVPHPEFAWVFGGSIFVGVPARNGDVFDAYVKELSILHVTRAEKLPPGKKQR